MCLSAPNNKSRIFWTLKCADLFEMSHVSSLSLQVIAIPDDDEKSPAAEQESKKNGEEPMETDKPSNGEAESVKEKEGEKEGEKEKEGESEKKSPEAGEDAKSPSEAKMEGSEVKSEDPEVKGKVQFIFKLMVRFSLPDISAIILQM